MALIYDTATIILQGQNVRPPLGTVFNGRSYWIKLHPELGNSSRSVLVVTMKLQFQFNDGPGGSWTGSEKTTFASDFVTLVENTWSENFRITTTSRVPIEAARDVGVLIKLPYTIDGYRIDEDFELGVTKVNPTDPMVVSSCHYNLGNVNLDSNDLRPENKGASMPQRAAVHEFGHMLGLRDEYAAANANPNYTGDVNSILNAGETVRKRHYVPFGSWMTEKFGIHSRLSRSSIDYKVGGTADSTNVVL